MFRCERLNWWSMQGWVQCGSGRADPSQKPRENKQGVGWGGGMGIRSFGSEWVEVLVETKLLIFQVW